MQILGYKKRNKKESFSHLLLWTIGLLALYIPSAVAPWWIFIQVGPVWGLLAGIVIMIPWVFAVQYKPAGINLGPFAVPLLFNAGGVFVSWTLQLF